MNALLLATLMFSMQAEALNPRKIHRKSEKWLIRRIDKEKDREDIRLILEEMALRRSPSFLSSIIVLSDHPLPEIRQSAMQSLIDYGPYLDDHRRDQVYLDHISDQNQGVSHLARKGIMQRIQSEQNISYLSNALLLNCRQSPSWRTQLYSIEILRWISGTDIDSLLIDLAQQNSNPQIRLASVSALGERRAEISRSTLRSIANRDLDSSVREAALISLQQIGGKLSDAVIAVMPFSVATEELKQLAEGFQHYLSGALSSAQMGTFVERGQVDKVMDELIFQDEFIDDSKAIEIGRSLRAVQVITGAIQSHGHSVTITIKLIDVSSQEILHSAQSSGLLVDFDSLQRSVATKFIESL